MARFISGNHVHIFNSFRAFQPLLRFSSTPTTTLTDSFANYLIDSLGFSHQQALSASNRLSKYRKVNDFNFDANATSVLTFLKSHGFNDTQLMKMVLLYPRLLTCNVEHTIKPKVQFFLDQGFSRSDLIRVISENPTLFQLKVVSSILPALQMLRQLLGSDPHVIAIIKKLSSWSFGGIIENLRPNVDLLTSIGIPIEFIRRHIVNLPGTYSQNPEKIKEIVIRVENKLGIPRDAPIFLYGISLLSMYSDENIESKCQVFKSFGWTQSDVGIFMMKVPGCFMLSYGSIGKKLDYLMNELRLKPAYLIHNSAFLTSSLEKRIIPRHKVLLILNEKGLLKKISSLNNAICMTESRFLDMFVIPFKEVHEFYAKHTGCCMKTLTQERAANYLMGFSHQQALSTLSKLSQYRKKVNFNFVANATSVVNFFKKHGFVDTHIRNFVTFYPRLLTANVENNIKPRLEFFHGQGLSGSDLIRVITTSPHLLVTGVESSILPAFHALRQVLVCDTLVLTLLPKILRHSFKGIIKNLLPNVDLLTGYGIPLELIRQHILRFPRTFSQNPEKLKEIVVRVEKKLWIPPGYPMFFYGIHLLSKYNDETLDSKCPMFKSFGWSQSDVDTFIMKNAVFSSDAFANYLVNSVGFSQQQALSASERLYQYRKANEMNFEANSVVTYFKNTLCPKLKFLCAHGFSGSDLIQVISMNPNLLSGSESSILSAVQILRQVLVCDTHVLAVLPKLCLHSINGVTKYLMDNVDLLSSFGIPIELIRELLVMKPVIFLQKPEAFKDTMARVGQRSGICNVFELFLYSILSGSSTGGDNYYSKIRLFMSFGWTMSDLEGFTKSRFNDVFRLSGATIKRRLDFLMNEMRLKPAYLTTYANLFNSNIEKKLLPRHKVLLALKEKGLIKTYPSVANSVLAMSEPCFLKNYVIQFKEVHQVYEEYTGRSMMIVLPRHNVLLILKEGGLIKKYPPSVGYVLEMPEPCFLEQFVIPFKEVHQVYAQLTGCSLKMLTEESSNIVT